MGFINIVVVVVLVILISLASYTNQTNAFTAIDVSTPIAYASTLLSSLYYPPQPASQFFGLMYMSVSVNGVGYDLSITVWHQIQFATNIFLNYYDVANGHDLMIPIATGTDASSNNCPINVIVFVDKKVATLIDQGKFNIQITSDGQPEGQLQGNIYRRNDQQIAFIHNYTNGLLPDASHFYATQGMALMYFYKDKQLQHENKVGYYIYSISQGLPAGGVFQANDVYSDNIAAFFDINAVQSTPATGVYETNKSILENYVVVKKHNYGVGSSNIFLSMLVSDNATMIFTPFVRLDREKPFTSLELQFSVNGQEGPLHPQHYNNRQEKTRWGAIAAVLIGGLLTIGLFVVFMLYTMGTFDNNNKKFK